jgi:hypothetical protein
MELRNLKLGDTWFLRTTRLPGALVCSTTISVSDVESNFKVEQAQQ